MSSVDLLALLVLAFTGAGHCAGMCGGFVIAAAGDRSGFWARLAVYHLTKTLSYVFIGLILLLALETAWARRWLEDVRSLLGWTLAAFLLGLGLAQVIRIRSIWGQALTALNSTKWGQALTNRLTNSVPGCSMLGLGSVSLFRAGLIGWLNGLLPCGLSLAAIFLVLRHRSIPDLVLGLVVFGLGTLPVLALVAFVRNSLSPLLRARLAVVSGWFLIVFAMLIALRSSPAGAAWLHQHFGDWLGLPADPWCR